MKHLFTLLLGLVALLTPAASSAKNFTPDDLTGQIVGQVFFGNDMQDGLPCAQSVGQFIKTGTNTVKLQGFADSFDVNFTISGDQLILNFPSNGFLPITDPVNNTTNYLYMTAGYYYENLHRLYTFVKYVPLSGVTWSATITDLGGIIKITRNLSSDDWFSLFWADEKTNFIAIFNSIHFFCIPDNGTAKIKDLSTLTYGEESSIRAEIDENNIYFYNWNDCGWAYDVTKTEQFEENGSITGNIDFANRKITIPKAEYGADVLELTGYEWAGYGDPYGSDKGDGDWFSYDKGGTVSIYPKYFQKNAQGGAITGKFSIEVHDNTLGDHWATDCGGHEQLRPATFHCTFDPWGVYAGDWNAAGTAFNYKFTGNGGSKMDFQWPIAQEKAELANIAFDPTTCTLTGSIVAIDEAKIVTGYDIYLIYDDISDISHTSQLMDADGCFKNAEKLNSSLLQAGAFSLPVTLQPGTELQYNAPRKRELTNHSPNTYYIRIHYREDTGLGHDTFDGLYTTDLIPSGIAEVEADGEQQPAEYFDLMGRAVASPTPGAIYLQRRGTEVRKVAL